MIPYKYFEDIIKALQRADDLIDCADDIVRVDFLCDLSMQDVVIDLLARLMNDHEDWINYWVYEMDFGRRWDDDTATEEDGTPIILKTPRQLYDYLIKNYGGNPDD